MDKPEHSSIDFLNEKEDWYGLTKKQKKKQPIQLKPLKEPTKKRAKYLTPCPDIQILRERPKFYSSFPILGNSLGPVKIAKQIIAVRNTSA